MKTLLLPVIK